jgi:polyhydroxyalkanoate synthase subunit PhaC
MVAASIAALQHAPRPLPLFLDLVRQAGLSDPALAARALAGVRRYGAAPRTAPEPPPSITIGPLTARVAGESGPLVLLVPSLINPASVMDLAPDKSLLRWLGAQGFRPRLVDWGEPTLAERELDLAGHVEQKLLPTLAALGEPVHLVGYCLGGVLALAAAQLSQVQSLTMIATPWHFARYPDAARQQLAALWALQGPAVEQIGLLPMELLQTAFWNLDPERTVAKFAALADYAVDDPRLANFVRLEDWANAGAPLIAAAGRDLFERLIRDDASGNGAWRVGGQLINPATLPCRARQLTAANDRIAPAATACDSIPAIACPSGHVGMMVGSGAEDGCWVPLRDWLSEPG